MAAKLFSEDSSYQVTPFEQPHLGQSGVHDYWAGVTEGQQNIRFEYQTIAISGNTGVAHWNAAFDVPGGIHIELDGMFVLDFDENGKCQRLREWWHAETESAENGS